MDSLRKYRWISAFAVTKPQTRPPRKCNISDTTAPPLVRIADANKASPSPSRDCTGHRSPALVNKTGVGRLDANALSVDRARVRN